MPRLSDLGTPRPAVLDPRRPAAKASDGDQQRDGRQPDAIHRHAPTSAVRDLSRDPAELDAGALLPSFRRWFYPLYKATKGVTVAGPIVLVDKLLEAADAGEIGMQRARLLAADTVIESVGRGDRLSKSTPNRSRAIRRELGLVLADGVLQEVEVDVGAVLEAALETDLWERQG
jgi:hypothetical protein